MDKNSNGKSKDSLIKETDEKKIKERIKYLMEKIKSNEYFDGDIAKSIINCFIIKNFHPLNINEIIEVLNDSIKFENNSQKLNLRNDVMNSLKNNIIFCEGKKKYKYYLHLENTASYLTSFLDSNSNSNMNNSNSDSKKSKKSFSTFEKDNNRDSPVFDFPKYQKVINYIIPEDNQQNMSSPNIDDNNSFTFGEQSQIKTNKMNKQNEEGGFLDLNEDEIKKLDKNNFSSNEFSELKTKALAKVLHKFEYYFDRNQYLSNLKPNFEEFIKSYENNNINNDINNNKNDDKDKNKNNNDFHLLDNVKKEIYLLIEDIELNKRSFNELSLSFNEEKEELVNLRNVMLKQFNYIKIIKKLYIFKDKDTTKEKENFKLYFEEFKKLFMEFQDKYQNVKLIEKKINEIISSIKIALKGICDNFSDNIRKEKYQDFCVVVENIEKNNENSPIDININETVKLFYCYINEFEKFYLDIERSE